MRDALVINLLRELLPTMPTTSGDTLADACNRCLDRLTDLRVLLPRVEAVDPNDGSVMMQAG